MGALHALDYVVLAVYLLVVIVIAPRVSRASPDADELFRAAIFARIDLPLRASNVLSAVREPPWRFR